MIPSLYWDSRIPDRSASGPGQQSNPEVSNSLVRRNSTARAHNRLLRHEATQWNWGEASDLPNTTANEGTSDSMRKEAL